MFQIIKSKGGQKYNNDSSDTHGVHGAEKKRVTKSLD